jgi:predicted O-methyltransferase YrrM
MDIIPEKLEKYISNHTSEEPELLSQLNRETHLKVLLPRMLSGHVQGRFLSMISKILSPKNILEIGTYTGYASICLAEGLAKNGKLITIDKNKEIVELSNKYFKLSGLDDKIEFKEGNALDIVPELNMEFDLIFIDADKSNYINYYKMCLPLLTKNGLIIIDNVLWSAKVTENKVDPKTKAIMDLNKLVQEDDNVDNVLVSVRDGLMLIRKK